MARKRRVARKTTNKKVAMGRCCPGGKPWFLYLILLVSVLWLLNDWGLIALDLPWLPLVVTLFALKMVWKHSMTCK